MTSVFFIFPFFLFFLSPCFLPLFSFRSSISFLFFLFPLFLFCSSFPCFPLSFFLFLSLFFPCEIQNKSKIINPLSHSAYRKAHAYIPISSSPWIKLLYRNILTTMLNFPGFRVEFVPASYILFWVFRIFYFFLFSFPLFGWDPWICSFYSLVKWQSRVVSAYRRRLFLSWFRQARPWRIEKFFLLLLLLRFLFAESVFSTRHGYLPVDW